MMNKRLAGHIEKILKDNLDADFEPHHHYIEIRNINKATEILTRFIERREKRIKVKRK